MIDMGVPPNDWATSRDAGILLVIVELPPGRSQSASRGPVRGIPSTTFSFIHTQNTTALLNGKVASQGAVLPADRQLANLHHAHTTIPSAPCNEHLAAAVMVELAILDV